MLFTCWMAGSSPATVWWYEPKMSGGAGACPRKVHPPTNTSVLQHPAGFEGSRQRAFVEVIKFTADRHAMGKAGDPDPGGL